ncbi:MAG: hypothetical protein ABIR94_01740 [Rubrivivax sp.]
MSTNKLHHAGPSPRAADVNGWLQDMKRLLGSQFGRRALRATPDEERIAIDARSVRELAREVRESDPGFSADLYAAADRHEHQREARH